MAARRGGLGKGLDSLIPKKIRKIDFDDLDTKDDEFSEEEKNEQQSESALSGNEPMDMDEPEEEDVEESLNPFALDEDDEEEFEDEDITDEGELTGEDSSDEEDTEEYYETENDSESEAPADHENEKAPEDFSEENSSQEGFSDNEENAMSGSLSEEEASSETNEEAAENYKNENSFDAGENSTNSNAFAEKSEEAHAEESSDTFADYGSGGENAVIMMRTSLVEPNRQQPRKKFNDATIEELAESIRLYGVIQPLLVQKRTDYYEIVAGERRWRAAKKAGLKEIPVIIREYSSQEAAEIALIENIQREDLNPIEEAQAYDRLIREFSLTQEEVASKVARSRSAITNSLRLLRLCEEVRDMVIRGDISEGHARAILALPSPGHQKMLAEQVLSDKLSVRETEKLIRKIMKPAKEVKESTKDMEREAALGKLGENLTNVFGTRVQVSGNSKGKGKIEIEFYSDEELERIYELLRSIQ